MPDIKRELDRFVERRVLSNGLPVCLFKKPGFQKKYAMFAVNYGSVDGRFKKDGRLFETPAGVAHFLEHKVFEQKDGEGALQKFASQGASPNAFTSQTMTAYHFECTGRFSENLRLLLQFVQNPYFTEENVKKEQGIIGQEIGMVNDNPNWRVFTGLFSELFSEHAISDSIIGTAESIGGITPELLYECHGTFYTPSNMALVAAGDLDFGQICACAEELTPALTASDAAQRLYDTGKAEKKEVRREITMEVSKPVFMLGFKDGAGVLSGEERRRHALIASLAGEYLCGASSPAFLKLYGENLLSWDFETEYVDFPGGGALVMGGESGSPEAVMDAVLKEADRVRAEGADEELFNRLKRNAYGRKVRVWDSPEALCHEQAACLFQSADFVNFSENFKLICKKDVEQYIINTVLAGRGGIYIVKPSRQAAR